MHTVVVQKKPHFSIPSIIAIAAAIATFFVRPLAGIALASVAIFFGVIGFLVALAPSIRGGLISFFSIILASIGIIIGIIKDIVR